MARCFIHWATRGLFNRSPRRSKLSEQIIQIVLENDRLPDCPAKILSVFDSLNETELMNKSTAGQMSLKPCLMKWTEY